MKSNPPLRLLIILTAFLFLFSSIGVTLAHPPQQQMDVPAIRLKVGTFIPGSPDTLNLPPSLTISRYPPQTEGDYIIQFKGPIKTEWQNAILRSGADIFSYIPDYAYKVRMTPEIAAAINGLPFINWVGIYQPAFKLDPALITAGTNLYRIRVEDGLAVDDVASQIDSLGGMVTNQNGHMIQVLANADLLDDFAQLLDVAWITNFTFFETFNEYGGGVIMGSATVNADGYDGSTQIVAVADTGFGTGVATTAHADVPPSRITAIQNFTTPSAFLCYNIFPDGAQDVDSGHGTHTTLSAVGAGGSSGEGRGTAPAANLVFQAVEEYIEPYGQCATSPDGYYLIGIPSDLTNLYQPAYDAGARVHSDSWGSNVAGVYTADSAATDTFMWDNPDMLIVFAAGNDGLDANANGIVDDDSMGSPGTAKNALTVGATENARGDNYPCDSVNVPSCITGFNSIFTYGAGWPADFPTNPLNSDPSAGNAEQMAAFSSRGPTDDGRIKPDVVAPGTWVLSGYSDRYQEFYDVGTNPQNGLYQYDGWGLPLNAQYKYMGGTSMATPLAAGGAAVVRDFYEKEYGHSASAALTKATLINSAVDILDENNDGADDNDFPIPNNHEGWGRVNLIDATDSNRSWVDETTGVGTGGSAQFQYFTCGASTTSFKATLAWTDFPSTEAAATNLVNDLDLNVSGPDGTFLGNNFSGGWSLTGGTADNTNNVENVYIQNPSAGTWTVTINGVNVPNGPQPFALVVNSEGSTCAPTAVTLENFSVNTSGASWLFIILLLGTAVIITITLPGIRRQFP